jgi:hypothetical protein
MGVFWRHRPFSNQNFGFNIGMASGQIENNLTADAPLHGEETYEVSYSVNYTENPVMYFGVNFGSKPLKGFQVGFDLGVLSTGGADILLTGYSWDPEIIDFEDELSEHPDMFDRQVREIKDKMAWTMLPNLQLTVSYGF